MKNRPCLLFGKSKQERKLPESFRQKLCCEREWGKSEDAEQVVLRMTLNEKSLVFVIVSRLVNYEILCWMFGVADMADPAGGCMWMAFGMIQ